MKFSKHILTVLFTLCSSVYAEQIVMVRVENNIQVDNQLNNIDISTYTKVRSSIRMDEEHEVLPGHTVFFICGEENFHIYLDFIRNDMQVGQTFIVTIQKWMIDAVKEKNSYANQRKTGHYIEQNCDPAYIGLEIVAENHVVLSLKDLKTADTLWDIHGKSSQILHWLL